MAQIVSYFDVPTRMDQYDFGVFNDPRAIYSVFGTGFYGFDDENYRYIIYGSFNFASSDSSITGELYDIRILAGEREVFSARYLDIDAQLFYESTFAPNDPMLLILAGNDELYGSQYDDYLYDRAGHNVLIGSGGRDTLLAGDGNDHIYGESPSGYSDRADLIYAGGGSDYVNGNAGNDTINGGDGSDRIQGGRDDDMISGENGNDTINGNLGNDSITGGSGNDSLRGGQGDDSINGGEGNDLIMGDLGADLLTGGVGLDVFVFGPGTSAIGASGDTITDYEARIDHIALGFTPQALLVGSNGSAEAAGMAAQALVDQAQGNQEVAMITVGSTTLLFWASDGGATIDSVVTLYNVGTGSFGLGDFI